MKIKNIIVESYNAEYDDEAGMAQGNLYTIVKAAQGLLDTIDDRDNLPEWTQEKIAKVEGMLVTVWNYLQSQKAQGIDPQQGVAENIDDDEDCDLCNGTGEGLYDGESCHKCHGTGVLSHQHSDDDFDEPDDDYDNYDEPESHYEKYVRTRGLEEQGTVPERAVDAKGRTQRRWIQLVQQQFPDARIIQAKMIDGPCEAILPDGRKLVWRKVEQGVDEARRANSASARAELNKRDRKADPVEQDKRKKEEDKAWERLQQHMADKNKEQDVAEGSVTKKPQPYNDPDWAKNLPKEKLDALAGPRYKKDKKDKSVAEAGRGIPDPQNYDSDWDYYNDRDAEAPEDDDADYENMIDEPDDWFDESREKVGNMDADAFDDAISRLKKLAGAGPLKTVYDPAKRVYRNVPTAQQPTKQPTK